MAGFRASSEVVDDLADVYPAALGAVHAVDDRDGALGELVVAVGGQPVQQGAGGVGIQRGAGDQHELVGGLDDPLGGGVEDVGAAVDQQQLVVDFEQPEQFVVVDDCRYCQRGAARTRRTIGSKNVSGSES